MTILYHKICEKQQELQRKVLRQRKVSIKSLSSSAFLNKLYPHSSFTLQYTKKAPNIVSGAFSLLFQIVYDTVRNSIGCYE